MNYSHIKKIFVGFIVLVVLALSVPNVYASEVTGTLSTVPDANTTNTPNSTKSDTYTPAQTQSEDTLQGTVTGGIPAANAQSNYDTTDAEGNGEPNYLWVWITIPAVLLIGAMVYIFNRPSVR